MTNWVIKLNSKVCRYDTTFRLFYLRHFHRIFIVGLTMWISLSVRINQRVAHCVCRCTRYFKLKFFGILEILQFVYFQFVSWDFNNSNISIYNSKLLQLEKLVWNYKRLHTFFILFSKYFTTKYFERMQQWETP